MASIDHRLLLKDLSGGGQGFMKSLTAGRKFGQDVQKQQMAQQQSEQLTDIFSRNVIQDPQTGQTQLNKPQVLTDLFSVQPTKAVELEKIWAAQDVSSQKAILDRQKALKPNQFAPTKLQKFTGEEGFVRTFDPSSSKVGYALDDKGNRVRESEVQKFIQGDDGKLYRIGTRTKEGSPKEIPGITPKGTKKARQDLAAGNKKLKKLDLDLELATKLAADGGQFKGSQYLASLYGQRMEKSMKRMDSLVEQGFDRSDVKYGMISKIPNFWKPGVLNAQGWAEINFLSATLRRESGAAIAASEYAGGEKNYFPRAGDTPDILADKKYNRQLVQANMRGEAGGAWLETQQRLIEIQNKDAKKIPSAVDIDKMNEAQLKKYLGL